MFTNHHVQKSTGKKQDASAFFQPKLSVNQPGDVYEQEADAMADKVMRMNDTSAPGQFFQPSVSHVQRKCQHCEEEEKMHRKESSGAATEATGQTENYINALNGKGNSLPKSERDFFEPRLGYDLSGVRVHTDAQANQSAKEVNALAYTHGSNIVFGGSQYQPGTDAGKRLMAHELTHVVQQQKNVSLKQIQRAEFGPAATGVPSTWRADVAAATTPAAKIALIQSALGSSVSVTDKTTASAADSSPAPAHLSAYSGTPGVINYDDNLNTKVSPVDRRTLNIDAGYTLHSGANYYIVLGPLALKADDYYHTAVILNHEFDHVRQMQGGSTLTGHASELDAWTSTFIREFHRTYILRDNGTTCFVQRINQFAPLLMYYTRTDVSTAQRDAAAQRIEAYHAATIAPHAAHSKVFKFWVHRTMQAGTNADLATRLNTDLSLGITASDSLATTRQFPCTGVTTATFPSAPSVNAPTVSAPATGTPVSPPARH